MSRKLTVLGLAALVLLAGTAMASTAFTTATVDRDVSVTIDNDNSGVVLLEDGTAPGAGLNNGKLLINASSDTLNRQAIFNYGNNTSGSAAKTSHAFKLTNNDDASHTFDLSYSGGSAVSFEIAYDSTGDGTVDTITDIGSGVTLNAGQSAYVVLIINTPDSTANLGGTLTISVS